MRRLLLLATFLFIFVGFAVADQITVQYQFDNPTMDQVRIAGEEFDIVVMPEAPNGGKVGEPSLPGYSAQILLPYGVDVKSIEVKSGAPENLGSGYYIKPVPKQYRLSEMPTDVRAPQPNEAIYGVDNAFPLKRFNSESIQKFRGYSILYLKLQPIEYYPVSGDVYFFPELTVVVNTEPSDKALENTSLFRGFPEDEEEVYSRVDNPEMIASYDAAAKRGGRGYDLLILTTPALVASFQPLKDYHDTTGLLTEIHTTTEVGSTNPDDVRAYIRDRYLNDGITYVIIGGDDDVIPAKDLYVETGPGGDVESNMPADIYFACLDGTYNYDGDSKWGEPTDGDGGGDVDLVAEVYVGRACVGNTTEAARFVNKTLTYVGTNAPYLEKVLLVGEHLGFGGVAEYANNAMDELVDGNSNSGYTTVGIPSSTYNIDKLYDYTWPGNNWPMSEVIARINSGEHIINHLGHGNQDYALKMYNSDVSANITNTDLCFIYSQTCLAGHFDGTDCWAEYMNIKIDYGAFAVIMNARYGFGEYNSTDGASQRFNREFWDAVFNPSEGKTEIGRANQDCKEDNLYRVNDECMRWVYYESTLFGDPSIKLKGVNSISFTYTDGVPETVFPGRDTTINVVVAGVGDGVPVSGTGELHYSINSGAYQTVAMTEVLTNEYEATLPAILCGDSLRFYVSAEEQVNGVINDVNPANAHIAIASTGIDTVFADDFETDKGWSVSGGQWARGVPTGGGGDHGNPDPTSGHDGPNVFGYNLNGDYGNNIPEYHLTSPSFDCSNLTGVKLTFWQWLGVEQSSYDHAYIRVSTDGTSWSTIWSNSGTIQDNSWNKQEYDISELADGQATVYIRFTMGTSDGSWTYCGWNIDDLQVTGKECADYGLTISTQSLPNWTVDNSYSQQLEAVNGVGTLVWNDKNGDLAGTGLALSSDGIVSGTPTAAGTISFIAEVTDDDADTDERQFTIVVNPHLNITTVSLPDWTAGHPFSQQLLFTGGTAPVSWNDKNGDLTGTGLALSADGIISGTPTSSGTITFTAEATDVAGDIDEQSISLLVNDVISITTDTLPNAVVSAPYSAQLTSSGGTGAKTWAEVGSNLGNYGLSLNASGQITGTPSNNGQVTFTAQATDVVGAAVTKQLTITITLQLRILTNTLPDWTVNIPYSQQLSVIGGVGTVSWTDKNGDLDGTGLTLSASGVVAGTVATPDTISFIAHVTDDDSQEDEKSFTFVINPELSVTTESVPDWTVGVPYSQQLATTGGTGTKTWLDKDGGLHGTGLSLAANGFITGTPTVFGQISFIAQVQDTPGAVAVHEFSFTVNSNVMITTLTLPAAVQGDLYSTQLAASGGTGTITWTDKNNDLDGSGLTLSADGVVSGTPINYGPITFTGVASDAVGASAEKQFTIEVNQALTINTDSLPDWTVNTVYSQQLEVVGGSGTKSWSDKNNDLNGTGLSLSTDGVLSGTPTTVGNISFIATVADSRGSVEKSFAFTINPAVAITEATLPEGTRDSAYSYQLVSTGGTGTISWLDRDTSLADYGLTLAQNGLVSGTATASGTVEFTAVASDICGSADEHLFQITIKLPYVCGDANGDGDVNVADAVYVINYVFKAGPAPNPMGAGDANGSGSVDVGDAVYLINFVFKNGDAPICP